MYPHQKDLTWEASERGGPDPDMNQEAMQDATAAHCGFRDISWESHKSYSAKRNMPLHHLALSWVQVISVIAKTAWEK